MDTGMQTLYADFSQFAQMRGEAQRHETGVLEEVVEQFESVFVQMVLSSMREASKPLESGLFQSDQSETFQQMYDQQLGMHLSEQGGIGLADLMLEQIGSNYSANPAAEEVENAGII
jgi:peptidoglycan hydrolase FlgJ